MATATPTKKPAKKPAPTALDHLQKAAKDLDKARDVASREARTTIDDALAKVREAAEDVRERARDQAGEWQEALERAGEEMRVELGRRAVRAQSSPEALKQLSAEIRKRKAELTPAP